MLTKFFDKQKEKRNVRRLFHGIEEGDLAAVRGALETGIDANASFHNSTFYPWDTTKTPLTIGAMASAATRGEPEIIALLSQFGAKITPLDVDASLDYLTRATANVAPRAYQTLVAIVQAGGNYEGGVGQEYSFALKHPKRSVVVNEGLAKIAPERGWSVESVQSDAQVGPKEVIAADVPKTTRKPGP